jgi:hypothetical protein
VIVFVSRPGRMAITYSAAIFVLGFVAMFVFWEFGSYSPSLAGFPSFRSATWGDGLFLPVQALAIKHITGMLPPRRGHWPERLSAGLGALLGALVVINSWLDPAPRTNWVMPRPHQFNAAGYWHSGFLIFACAVFAHLWTDFLLRLRSARISGLEVRPALNTGWFALAVGATEGYAALVLIDRTSEAATLAGASSLGALAAAGIVLVVLLALATGRDIRSCVPGIVTGLAAAGAIVALILLFPR